VIISGLAARSGLRVRGVWVPHRGRRTGTVSIVKWRLWKAAAHMVRSNRRRRASRPEPAVALTQDPGRVLILGLDRRGSALLSIPAARLRQLSPPQAAPSLGGRRRASWTSGASPGTSAVTCSSATTRTTTTSSMPPSATMALARTRVVGVD
jgi:hypothetical protein